MKKRELLQIFEQIVNNKNLSKDDIIKLAQNVLDKEIQDAKENFEKLCEDLKIDNLDKKNFIEIEKEIIAKSLIKFNNNLTEVAKYLNLGRATIYRKVLEYNLIDKKKKNS